MLGRIRARLIDNWRSAWRLWSVQISFVGLALSAGWQVLPYDVREHIPGQQWISVAFFLLVIVSRLFSQEGKKNGE